VYRANDRALKRPVAVKVLTEQIVSDEELRRFHRGALAACAVKHENCVQMYDFGMTPDERPYMVMEFVGGSTLRRIVQERGPLPAAKAVQMAILICEGLTAIHANALVHRDLKTANVMVDDFDSETPLVKILDFGLAKLAIPIEPARPITKTGHIVGSPVYMSPEQVKGQYLDARSDIYSTGCIMFELLTGEPLFLGKTSLETMSMHVMMPPPTLSEAAPQRRFLPVLESIVAKAVAKNPEERFQTAEQMLEMLRSAAEQLTSAETLQKIHAPSQHFGRLSELTPRLMALLLIAIALMMIGTGTLLFLAKTNNLF
jgi:serine/threonine-protein kinase